MRGLPWTLDRFLSPLHSHLPGRNGSKRRCSCPGSRHACLAPLYQIPTVTFVPSIQGCWHLWKETQSSNQFHTGFHTKQVGQQEAGAASDGAENFRAAGLNGAKLGLDPRGLLSPPPNPTPAKRCRKMTAWQLHRSQGAQLLVYHLLPFYRGEN